MNFVLAVMAIVMCAICVLCMAGSVAVLLGEETTPRDMNFMLTSTIVFGLCAGCLALVARLMWPA